MPSVKLRSSALQLFEGRIRYANYTHVDQEIAALLLERILPGGNLRALKDKSEQLEIGAELVAQLPFSSTGNSWITHLPGMDQQCD